MVNMTSRLGYMFNKLLVFVCMYLGYTVYVLNRKCFTYAMPDVIKQEGLDEQQLGLIVSSQTLAYTVSKFIGGVLADHVNFRLLFASGLLLSGVITFLFTVSDSVVLWTILWFLCGLVQGGGWPAGTKILRQWCFLSEFGTWYSVLSTSMNLAGSVGPLLATHLVSNYGWRISMYVPGMLSICFWAFCLLLIKNSPAEAGFAHMSTESNSQPKKQGRKLNNTAGLKEVLKSPLLWVICLCYFFIYILRTATMDWGQLYLIQEKQQNQYVASIFLSSLEIGGIVGSVVAGYLADKLTEKKMKGSKSMKNPRILVMVVFTGIILASLHMFNFMVGKDSSEVLITGIGFALGFGLYGPVALYAVVAIECAPNHLGGTCHAIVALASNVGAVMSGLPLSYVAARYNWNGVFMFLEILMVCTLLVKIIALHMEYRIGPPIKKKKLE